MADKNSKKKSSKTITAETTLTNYLTSVVDSTKVLVDDLLENAKNAESGARKRVNAVADKDLRKTLKKQTKALNEQVEKLTKVRKGK
ncbi:hypothetical protein [Tsukamurella soli]|uniref:Histone H1 n=1 Tax=Tsukamurella soli TaxID=644556 RepID=A0ABP8JCL8_9ACTN